MRLATEGQTTKPTMQSPVLDQSLSSHLHQWSRECKTSSLPKDHPPQNQDYLQIVARATSDAVRDWDLISGALSWPQGLETLLGYDLAATDRKIGFWQNNVHPEDRARTAAAIRDTLDGTTQHWSGEYRFRRADGNYV